MKTLFEKFKEDVDFISNQSRFRETENKIIVRFSYLGVINSMIEREQSKILIWDKEKYGNKHYFLGMNETRKGNIIHLKDQRDLIKNHEK